MDFVVVLALGVFVEELLVELRIGDVCKLLIFILFFLLPSVLVVVIIACGTKGEDEDCSHQASHAGSLFLLLFLSWRLLLLDFFLFVFGGGQGGFLLFELVSAFRARFLCQEAVTAAFWAGAKLACYLYAAIRTGASHRGDLTATFGTFNDAHLFYF